MSFKATAVPLQKELLTKLENKAVILEFDHGKWCGFYLKGNYEFGNIIVSPPDKPFEFMIRNDISPDTTTNYGYPGVQSQIKNLNGGKWPADTNVIQWLGYDKLPGPNDTECLDIHYSCGDYLFKVSYYLHAELPELTREIKLYNNVPNNNFLYQISLSMPFFSIGEADHNVFEIYDVRNHLKNLRHPLTDLDENSAKMFPGRLPKFTAMDSDFHHEISFVLQNSKLNLSLICWGYSPDYEAVSYYYEHRKNSISFTQAWFPFCPLKEKRQINCRRQIISFSSGDWAAARNTISKIKKNFVWNAPEVPAKLKEKVIYQVHGFIADFGGFNGLCRKLHALKQLGVDIIYLPPLAPPEAYLNYKPDNVAGCYGSDEEFTLLVKTAHELGMEVIVDMIAHHIFRQAPEAQIPEFIRYDECGNPLSYSIGAVLTETRNPKYQRYFIDCCRNLVEKYDIDGFRFDVAGFQLPNWDMERITYERPGMGVLGQTELLRKLKAELDRIKPLIYLEEGMGVNGFRYVSHGFIHLTKQLREDALNGFKLLPELLKTMQYIFEDKIFKERPGVITMYHCKIHDTVLMQQLGTAITGVDRALTALIMTVDSVPLLTQGMERGYYDMIRCLSAIKKQYPEFSYGAMNFHEIFCDNDNVFTFSRNYKGSESIVAINFSDTLQVCDITYPAITEDIYELYPKNDLFKNPKGLMSLQLPPFACKIFKLSGTKKRNIEYEPQTVPFEIKEARLLSPVIQQDEKYYYICRGDQGITISKSNAMISGLNREHVDNCFYAAVKFPDGKLRKQVESGLNEGAFSGTYAKALIVPEDIFLDNAWNGNEYDASHWFPVFVPSTRLPYSQSLNLISGTYIEDIIPDALNVLWTRHPGLRQGKSYFRKIFLCKGKVAAAKANFMSPAMYDFDLAVQNGGINYPLMEQTNACCIYINGQRMEPDATPEQTAGMLRLGNNCIAVECRRGHGAHGIIGDIKFKYSDGTEDIVKTDSSWECFPGTIFKPIILNHCAKTTENTVSLIFKGILESIDNTSFGLNRKAHFTINYRFSADGRIDINLDLSEPIRNSGIFWRIVLPNTTHWFAANKNNSFREKISCWSDVRNAYSGSVWPVWNSNEFEMVPPFKFGVIQAESAVQCTIENENIITAEIFSDGKSGTLLVHTQATQLTLNLSIITNKGIK